MKLGILTGTEIYSVLRKIKSIKLNQNILIFGFFLLVSSLFWFFNALNKEYNTELIIPVEYINTPENKLLADGQSGHVNVRITALGYRIINYKTIQTEPLIINLKKYKPKPIFATRNRKFYILTESIKNEINTLIGKDLELNIIGPDSLIFNMDEVISKRIPARGNFEIACKKQFMLKNKVEISPDSITIKGVKSMLDTLSAVYTVFDRYTDLEASRTFDMELIKIPGTEFSTKFVQCKIDVEEYTELNFEMPIAVMNAPAELNIKIFPANAKIAFNVGFSRYQSIYKNQFRLYVDYKEAGSSQQSVLHVKVAKSPEHINAIRINPKSVNYIIEKND